MNRIRAWWWIFLKYADGHIDPPRNAILRALLCGQIGRILLGVFIGLCVCSTTLSFVMAWHISEKQELSKSQKSNKRPYYTPPGMEPDTEERAAQIIQSMISKLPKAQP